MKSTNSLKNDQRGLAAITITFTIIIVITLIVLAFSQIARREQRQSLDRQLSSSAFYAAESGINDAIGYIKNPANAGALQLMDFKKDKCSPNPPELTTDIDIDKNYQKSCLLFDMAPNSLEYSSVDDYRGELISLKTPGGVPKSVTVQWHDTDGGANFGGCVNYPDTNLFLSFPKKSDYATPGCDAGMLKLLFMPVKSGAISRESLVDDSFTAYLRPARNAPASTLSYARHAAGSDNQGNVIPASCDPASGLCKATIDNISGYAGLYLRISSIYSNSVVSITGADTVGAPARFNDAQIKVDSTGKASDVLKRLQVRVPLYERYDTPPYVLESMNGICKRLNVYSGSATNADCGGIN